MFKGIMVVRNTLITFMCMLLIGIVAGVLINSSATSAATRQVVAITNILQTAYEREGSVSGLEKNAEGVRVTVINTAGRVLYDSSGDIDSDHLSREEVVAALNGTPKAVLRVSATLGKAMMYYAVTAVYDNETFILRTALPRADIYEYVWSAIGIIFACLIVCTLIYIFIAENTRQKVLKPFTYIKTSLMSVSRGGEASAIPSDFKDSEVNASLAEISLCSEKIQETIAGIDRERSKLDYVVSNMGQGIIMVNADLDVVLKNRDAESILGGIGYNLESLSEERIIDAARRAIENGVAATYNFDKDSSIYEVRVNAAGEGERFAIVTVRNVTDVASAERSRREFFANASHELKTPLTSIRGFAELIAGQLSKKNDGMYANKIVAESCRMLALIDDMLSLSHLDEGGGAESATAINVKTIIENVAQNLKPQAGKSNVTITTELEDITMNANAEHITELVTNLLDNAVKYNVKGGSVKVRLFASGDKNVFAFEDTGIGIPEADQPRIFERFYRVDKGRSRESGGTGLGLAIVKHIAARYNGEITLKSALNKGTDIRVAFPIEK